MLFIGAIQQTERSLLCQELFVSRGLGNRSNCYRSSCRSLRRGHGGDGPCHGAWLCCSPLLLLLLLLPACTLRNEHAFGCLALAPLCECLLVRRRPLALRHRCRRSGFVALGLGVL